MTIRSDDSQNGKGRPTKATEGRKEELEEAERGVIQRAIARADGKRSMEAT